MMFVVKQGQGAYEINSHFAYLDQLPKTLTKVELKIMA